MNKKKNCLEDLRKVAREIQEQNKDRRYDYFICARDKQSNDAFSTVDADRQVLMALLASAMRTDKDVEYCIMWIAEHYKQLNIMVNNGRKYN